MITKKHYLEQYNHNSFANVVRTRNLWFFLKLTGKENDILWALLESHKFSYYTVEGQKSLEKTPYSQGVRTTPLSEFLGYN